MRKEAVKILANNCERLPFEKIAENFEKDD